MLGCLLAELYSASISGRIGTGPRAGRSVIRVSDGEDLGDASLPAGKCCSVCVPARDRMRLKRLARYEANLLWLRSGRRFCATEGIKPPSEPQNIE